MKTRRMAAKARPPSSLRLDAAQSGKLKIRKLKVKILAPQSSALLIRVVAK